MGPNMPSAGRPLGELRELETANRRNVAWQMAETRRANAAEAVVEAARELERTFYDQGLPYRETFGWPEYERLYETLKAYDAAAPTPETETGQNV